MDVCFNKPCPFDDLKCLKIDAVTLEQNDHKDVSTMVTEVGNYLLQNSQSATFIMDSPPQVFSWLNDLYNFHHILGHHSSFTFGNLFGCEVKNISWLGSFITKILVILTDHGFLISCQIISIWMFHVFLFLVCFKSICLVYWFTWLVMPAMLSIDPFISKWADLSYAILWVKCVTHGVTW